MKKFFTVSIMMLVFVMCVFPAGAFAAMNSNQFTTLCTNGTAQQIEAAIKNGANVNGKNQGGVTPLIITIYVRSFKPDVVEIVSLLLKNGADVNLASDGMTPLMAAALTLSPEIVSVLLRNGADVSIRNRNGMTAIDYVSIMSNQSKSNTPEYQRTVELLTASNANGNRHAMSDNDFYALCENGTAQQIETAIKNGANLNVRNNSGITALMRVAHGNSPEAVSVLLRNGADVNATSNNGTTALMLAALNNTNTEVISILLQNGADVNATSNDGYTALMMVADGKSSSPEVISVLLRNGADASIIDKDGKRAIDYASENANLRDTPAYQQLLAATSNAGETSQRHEGAALFEATVAEWTNADPANKLVACSLILEAHHQRQLLNLPITTYESIKPFAEALVQFVDLICNATDIDDEFKAKPVGEVMLVGVTGASWMKQQ